VLINLLASAAQADGTYLWQIPAASVAFLKSGSLYASVTTATNPSGELRGQLGRSTATGTFTPPADPPTLPTTLPTANEAARFLTQATFGRPQRTSRSCNAMATMPGSMRSLRCP